MGGKFEGCFLRGFEGPLVAVLGVGRWLGPKMFQGCRFRVFFSFFCWGVFPLRRPFAYPFPSSPHAGGPVDWVWWCEEAGDAAAARRGKKGPGRTRARTPESSRPNTAGSRRGGAGSDGAPWRSDLSCMRRRGGERGESQIGLQSLQRVSSGAERPPAGALAQTGQAGVVANEGAAQAQRQGGVGERERAGAWRRVQWRGVEGR